jgi:hypothetical protein
MISVEKEICHGDLGLVGLTKITNNNGKNKEDIGNLF